MTKMPPLGVRLEPDEHTALQAAATREERTLSAMARRYILAGLRADGLLLPPPPASKEGAKHDQ